jgi:hypothetical protein
VELTAALIREQGVEFAVVLVKQHITRSGSRDATVRGFASFFPGRPIVLCSQDFRGTPTYYGRPDLVKFLATVAIQRLPWKKFITAAA